MRLLINTASTLKGGGVQVAASVLSECKVFSDWEFGVVLGPGLSDIVRDADFPKNFRFFRLDYRPAQRVLSFRRSGEDLSQIEASFSPDAVFTTSGPSYWRPHAPHLMGFNLPHHLYPDSPYFTRILSPAARLRWRAKSVLIHHYTKRFADAWVVQTDDVNQRLRQWISSENVYTVPNTVSEAFLSKRREHGDEPDLRRQKGGGFRLLVLSSYYRHKNLDILNEIIDLMRNKDIRSIRFTMTLPTRDYETIIFPENREWIDNLGPQLPNDCPALYESSDALFLPSLLECFSANYVEAMAMKRPIVTTDLGFARTICSNAALYYEPMNAGRALKKIIELSSDEELYASLVRAGQIELRRFGTPKRRAEAYLSLCRKLAEMKPPQLRAALKQRS